MHYDDYDLEYIFEKEYNLDENMYYEYSNTLELDEDYARDTLDYNALAYKHYAWYNTHTCTPTPIMLAQKRLVTVTLDIMCYDDLELDNIQWNEILGLEGDEEVHHTIREYDDWDAVPVLWLAYVSG